MNIFAQIRIRVIFLCLLALASYSAVSEENPVVASVNKEEGHGYGGFKATQQKTGAAVYFQHNYVRPETSGDIGAPLSAEGRTLTFTELYDDDDTGSMTVWLLPDDELTVTVGTETIDDAGSYTFSLADDISHALGDIDVIAPAGDYYLKIFVEVEPLMGDPEYRAFAIHMLSEGDYPDEIKEIPFDAQGHGLVVLSVEETTD